VKDTGIGIKEDQLSRLFQAFTQADPSTARNFGGSGLGLMISNRILNLFDSALEVESISGVGSTFSFEIEVEEVLEKRDQVKDTFEAEHFAKLQKKVLIVEDNELNMFIAATLLKGILPKCTIFEALNYSSALNIFEYEKPDLVFLDLEIPVLSGFEIAGQMREMEKRMEREETTVIALTARVTAETRMNCIDAGMNDYLTKPIELNELHRVLVDFLEKTTRRDK
jgi:CheY-like chemotaxis protein